MTSTEGGEGRCGVVDTAEDTRGARSGAGRGFCGGESSSLSAVATFSTVTDEGWKPHSPAHRRVVQPTGAPSAT